MIEGRAHAWRSAWHVCRCLRMCCLVPVCAGRCLRMCCLLAVCVGRSMLMSVGWCHPLLLLAGFAQICWSSCAGWLTWAWRSRSIVQLREGCVGREVVGMLCGCGGQGFVPQTRLSYQGMPVGALSRRHHLSAAPAAQLDAVRHALQPQRVVGAEQDRRRARPPGGHLARARRLPGRAAARPCAGLVLPHVHRARGSRGHGPRRAF